MKIAFLGPVATGKTTWARILAYALQAKFIDVEGPAYHTIDVLNRKGRLPDGDQIELVFLGSEVYLYLSTYYNHEKVVYASHPLVCMFYMWTLEHPDWFVEILDKVVEKLPKPDLAVLFRYTEVDVDELLARIHKRAREQDRIKFEELCVRNCLRYYSYVEKRLRRLSIPYIEVHIREPAVQKLDRILSAVTEKFRLTPEEVETARSRGLEMIRKFGLT